MRACKGFESVAHTRHPVTRILLDMARPWSGGRVGAGEGFEHIAVDVHEDGLDRARSDIDADQGGSCHTDLPRPLGTMAFCLAHPL